MSIKLLLIVSDEKFLQEIEQNYKNHIERGFFEIFTPKDVENNSINYEVIIAENKYLSLIPIDDIPIIVINKMDNDEILKSNVVNIKQPLNWNNLYDLILQVQYRFKSQNLIKINNPNIKTYNYSSISTLNKKKLYITKHNFEKKEFDYINTKNYEEEEIQENNNDNNDEKFDLSPISEISKDVNINKNNNEKINNLKLSTKFYNIEDMKRVHNILNVYGSKNSIHDRIIAQASIILDELVYILESLNYNSSVFNSKDPKVLMKIHNSHKDFNINLECLIPMEKNIQNFISIAENYGNTIESFQRNNSYFINIHWEL